MTSVKVELSDTQKILLKRHLNKNGEAQKFFTNKVERVCNNYVPWKTGRLKDKDVIVEIDKIIYKAPYAGKQYYSNKGMGKEGLGHGGMRGKFWDKRAWADNGNKIVKEVAKFCGGR